MAMAVFFGACLFFCGFMIAMMRAIEADKFIRWYGHIFSFLSVVPMMMAAFHEKLGMGGYQLASMLVGAGVMFLLSIRLSKQKRVE